MQSYYEQAASLAAGATESFAKMTQQVLADTALVVKPSPLDEMASTSGDLSVLLESKVRGLEQSPWYQLNPRIKQFDRERLDGLEKLLAVRVSVAVSNPSSLSTHPRD